MAARTEVGAVNPSRGTSGTGTGVWLRRTAMPA
jgi:hypothetical protein